MDRVPRPSRIEAFWQTLVGVHPSPVLIAIGKILLGVLAIPLIVVAIVCSIIWGFYWLGNRITKSTVALIESRYVE